MRNLRKPRQRPAPTPHTKLTWFFFFVHVFKWIILQFENGGVVETIVELVSRTRVSYKEKFIEKKSKCIVIDQ